MNIKLNSGEKITIEKPETIIVICTKTFCKTTLPVTHSKLTIDESGKCATLRLGAKCSCGEIHTASITRTTDERETENARNLPTPSATKILLAPEPDYDE